MCAGMVRVGNFVKKCNALPDSKQKAETPQHCLLKNNAHSKTSGFCTQNGIKNVREQKLGVGGVCHGDAVPQCTDPVSTQTQTRGAAPANWGDAERGNGKICSRLVPFKDGTKLAIGTCCICYFTALIIKVNS